MEKIGLKSIVMLLIFPLLVSVCEPLQLENSYDLTSGYKISLIVPLDVTIDAPKSARPNSSVVARISVRQRDEAYISIGGSRGRLPRIGKERKIDVIKGVSVNFRATVVVFVSCEGPCFLTDESLFFEREGSKNVELRINSTAEEGDEVTLTALPEYRAEMEVETPLGTFPIPMIRIPADHPIYREIEVSKRYERGPGPSVGLLVILVAMIILLALILKRSRRGDEGESSEEQDQGRGGDGEEEEWTLEGILG